MAAEERLPLLPSLEDPEVFEIILPITIFELSNDFLEYGDEEQTVVKEDRIMECEVHEEHEDQQLHNHKKSQTEIVEVVKIKEAEETVITENKKLVLDDKKWEMGFLDKKQDGSGIACVKIMESNDNFDHMKESPCLSSPEKGVIQKAYSVVENPEVLSKSLQENMMEPLCMDMNPSANSEGAAALKNSNEDSHGPRMNIGLEDDVFKGSKSEDSQAITAENEQCSPGNFPEKTVRTKNGCGNDEPDVFEHSVHLQVTDCSELCDLHENLNGSSEDMNHRQQVLRQHTEKPLLQGNISKRKISLITTREKYTRRGIWKCLYCNWRFMSPTQLRKHLRVNHKNKKFFKCNFCNKTSFFPASFKCHHKLHMSQTSFKERQVILKKRWKNQNDTAKGRKIEEKIAVKGKTSKKEKYEKFFREMKRNLKPSKRFNCKICPFSSRNPRLIMCHIKMHNDGLPYRCPQCEYSSENYSCILNHLYWHAGYKLFKCNFCTFFSQYVHSMIRHSFLHTGAMPYRCPVCNLGFTSASNLKRHVSTVSHRENINNLSIINKETLGPQKKYICHKCEIVFYTYKHFQCHRKYHLEHQDKRFPENRVKNSKKNSYQNIQPLNASGNEEVIKKQLMPECEQDNGSRMELRAQKRNCQSNVEWNKMSGIFPNTYVCQICGLVFHRKKHLLYHKDIHLQAQPSEKKPHNYQVAKGNNKLPAIKHSYGPALKLFKCHCCLYTTSSFSNLQVHFFVHTGKMPFKCHECEKSFRSTSHLKRHKLSHLQKNKCNQCLFVSRSVKEFKMHQEICSGKDPAHKRFQSSSLSNENPEKQINMTEVKGNTSTLGSKENDLQIHKCDTRVPVGRSYSCDVCQRKFYRRSHLKRHMLVHQNVEYFKCSSCDFSSGNWQSFKKHMASHQDSKILLRGQLQKKSSLPIKMYKCEKCDYATTRNGNLKVHFQIHTGERPHKCTHCSLAFRTSSHLNRHLATHFKCDRCKFCARNRHDLQQHIQNHRKISRTQKKKADKSKTDYKCTKCHLSFLTLQLLEGHQKKHKNKTKQKNKESRVR